MEGLVGLFFAKVGFLGLEFARIWITMASFLVLVYNLHAGARVLSIAYPKILNCISIALSFARTWV